MSPPRSPYSPMVILTLGFFSAVFLTLFFFKDTTRKSFIQTATPITFDHKALETPHSGPEPSYPSEPDTTSEPPPPFSTPGSDKNLPQKDASTPTGTPKEDTSEPKETPKEETTEPKEKFEQPEQPKKESGQPAEPPKDTITAEIEAEKNDQGKKPRRNENKDEKASTVFDDKLSKINNDPWNQEKVFDREGTSAFLQNGGLVSNVDRRRKVLCKLGNKKACDTNYIADSIDMMYAFTPLYAVNQQVQADLYQLHDEFVGYIHSIGIPHLMLEAIIPSKNQKYIRTTAGKEPYEIQITVEDTFYYRENFLNVMAKKTLDVWEYMLWIDAHQVFQNIYWWEESIYKMEQNNIAHLFYHVKYMRWANATFLELDTVTYQYRMFNELQYGTNYFAGNAWGIRKDMYLKLGYILDTCIAGGCDYSLCYSLLKTTDDWPGGFRNFPYYFEQLKPWIHEAHDVLKESYGNVRGVLFHRDHSHLFDYFGIQNRFAHGGLNIEQDLYRDENFTLHLKNQQLKKFFPW